MANRDYGRSGRGGPYDRDYDRGGSSERERDERWERGEFAGGRDYGRGRGYDREDRDDRGHRSNARESGYGDEWQYGRSAGAGRDNWEQSYRERMRDRGDAFGGGAYGRGSSGRDYDSWQQGAGSERRDQFDRGRYERGYTRGDPRGETSDREYGGIGSSSFGGGFGGYGPMGGGFAGNTPPGAGYGGYAGYGSGGLSGYGPSSGFGYSGAGGYIGRDYGSAGTPRGTNFTGRGPRGYKRSDERIREDINEALWRHPDVDASDVEIRVENAEVVLTGVVEDRRMKRLVEDVAEDVWGVNDVRNELKVRHGFLAALTGERVDEREVERTTAKETLTGAQATSRSATPARSSSTTPGT
jgi:hypothetical protein